MTTATARRRGQRRSGRSGPHPGSPRPRWRPCRAVRGPPQAAGGPGEGACRGEGTGHVMAAGVLQSQNGVLKASHFQKVSFTVM